MIKTAIICPNDIIIAFDERGRQILEYHSQCDQVKGKILKDAPPDTLFGCFPDYDTELRPGIGAIWREVLAGGRNIYF